MDLRPDLVIADKLRLIRPLGQGGMGVVWAARHLTLETDVAVKLIRPERAVENRTLPARFEREARATARIAHPHVVQVMDYGAVDGVPYLVMELLRGFTLAELLERGGRLSFATAKALVTQVGGALESAHEHGVVHRDIKPHNVFITEESRGYPLFVKVLDFGVAKMLGEAEAPSTVLTETGVVVGSAPYMSPEQLEGRKDVDLRADLWSLGVIVYESLTGAQPFQGSSFVTIGAAVLKGRYRPATEIRPSLPISIDDWFAKALSLDPAARFTTAREMVDAFLALEQEAPAPESEAPAPVAPALPYATTVEVAVDPAPESPAPLVLLEGGTAAHAPVVARPDPAPAPSRRGRILLIAAAAGALIAGGARAWAPVVTHSVTCPPGMALIQGATFAMGSAAEAETPSDETPLHGVTVRSFCMDLTEVTVQAYRSCASCDKPTMTVEFEGLTPKGRDFESQFCNRPEDGQHPINCVDWQEAKGYCQSLGKRLPSEAEWEFVARGREGRVYPWGAAPPSGERLNACGSECSKALTERRKTVGKIPWPAMYAGDDQAPFTAPVGSYPAGATPAGVLDLAGNVWEWTESPYCPYGKDDCGDSRRVLRGGGWDTTESQDVRAARRYPSAPTARGKSVGFRCARTL